MTEFTVHNETGYTLHGDRLGDHVASLRESMKNLPDELSLVFVPVSTMTDLHETYYGEPGPTDVLAFPYDDTTGEIFICPEIADRQRERSGNTLSREVLDLLVHALLHLEGYDHTREGDDGAHLNRQSELMDRLADTDSRNLIEAPESAHS